MASPGNLKGQRRGTCGHAMAAFDLHEKCARCRDKKMGEDPCVKGLECVICEGFSNSQQQTLSTPAYKIRKDRKSGALVSPKDVTVISSVEMEGHASPPSAQVSAHAPAPSTSSDSSVSFVTSAQLEAMSDKWTEHFARFEALLSRGNVFSMPKSSATVSAHPVLSDKPFIDPSARPTGPVVNPAEQDLKVTKTDAKKKKASKPKTVKAKSTSSAQPVPASTIPGPGDAVQEPVFQPVSSFDTSLADQTVQATGQSASRISSGPQAVHESFVTGPDVEYDVAPSSLAGAGSNPLPEQVYRDPPVQDISDDGLSDEDNSLVEEGEVSSDNLEKQEQTEDMTFRETVRSVRSFMGWDYIPVFESDLAEPDKSNNPWRGKHPRKPARISVAMPPDDWLCQKLEKLNTTVAEGYPSRAHDSAGLKKDQFIKIPKSQGRWYQMHTLKQDGPHRPGKSLFSWNNGEAKVNSQFPKIVKASYPPSGPPSRPISQEYLRRWERCAREGSYVVNSAAGFNCCASELQERIASNVSFLCGKLNKGKAPKDVSESLRDIKDLLAFHQNVSMAMGTALQHLADSLFVHLANLILLRRDSYLEFVKPGIKPDTWNLLRNAPMFGYGLFPDSVLGAAEQDVIKHESTGVAPGPGPGASQRSNWRGNFRYKPYDRKDSQRRTESSEQELQPWRQFSRNRGRGRARGRANSRFSKSRGFKPYK